MEWNHEGKPPFGSVAQCWMANDSVRTVTHDARGWRYADCTYPMQNVICDPEDIRAWRFNQPERPNYPTFADSWGTQTPPGDPLVNAALSWLWG